MPNEVFSSLLAATTAFIGGNLLNLPVWGIFIGWAATYLAGGPNRATLTKLWPAMAAGSTFALVIVLLDAEFGTVLGSSTVAKDAVLAVVMPDGRGYWPWCQACSAASPPISPPCSAASDFFRTIRSPRGCPRC
jgi:hypothetical protein